MNYKQQEEKERKLIEFRDLLKQLKNNVNGIKELSEKLGNGFSKSTIQRYIHELYEKHLIDEEEYKEYCEWMKNNKKAGNFLGGKHNG